MRVIIIMCLGFNLLLNSCQGQEHSQYIDLFQTQKDWFEKTAYYLNSNFEGLSNSPCTDSLGVTKITNFTVNEMSCYGNLADTLSSILKTKHFQSAELRKKDQLEFVIGFVPNDELDLETTYYLVYLKDNAMLPDYYKDWVGHKEKLNKDWWFLEYRNAQF